MQRQLVSYDSSSDSGESARESKKLKRIAAGEDSEVSSSVVEGDPGGLTAGPIGDRVTKLIEMGCSFEEVVHAISICGHQTEIPDLFDFIKACEFPTGEESNTLNIGEPHASPVHITNSCGSTEKQTLRLKTPGYIQGQCYTDEASCSRSHDVKISGQGADESAFTLQKLDRMGFTGARVQRASEQCNSIDFDVLLEYLLDAKDEDLQLHNAVHSVAGGSGHDYEEENAYNTPLQRLDRMGYSPALVQRATEECNSIDFDVLLEYLVQAEEDIHLQDQVYSKVDSSGDEHVEVMPARKLQNMGFPSTPIKKAIGTCASWDFEGLLSASENQKPKRDLDLMGDGKQPLAPGESKSAILHKKNFSSAENVGTSRNKLAALQWSKHMEKLWYTYIGGKKKRDPFLESDESDDDMLQPPEDAKSLKSRKGRKKLEFHDSKQVDEAIPVQGKMMGFGVPELFIGRPKPLPYHMQGPPYFYFENVASVPNNEWDTIKRHFNGVDPEFTDSLYFSASRRPRGYVHNLPIDDRSPLSCTPPTPMSIFEAFPDTRKYWPSWDTREKLNCINTRKASDSPCGLIRRLSSMYEDLDIPYHRQQEIVQACKKWNLVWVGPGQTAPLKPHEIELLLGFDRDHTRGCSSITERYDALGNSFQVNTVAYHLSPLRYLYPDGITVLSLFSGIGGAEVALHKLGIHLKAVIAVEINEKVRGVLASWWKKSGQMGELKLRNDVRDLTIDVLSDLIDEVGRIDLIIGGSPCSNLSGNNRVSRVGLNGSESSLFFEFPRILTIVMQVMRNRCYI